MEHMIDIIIPTYKPDKSFELLIAKLQKQTIRPNKIILMNTEEKYIKKFLEESELLEKYDNIEIHHVSETEFDHGKTRDLGVQLSKAPYFLCMTQDAVPYDNFLIEGLKKAINLSNVEYINLCNNLSQTTNKIRTESFNNLKNVIIKRLKEKTNARN